jgi:prostaglandin-E synthase 1
MNPLADNPAMQLYFASTVILGLNLLVLANNTALSRAKAVEVVNPEDKRIAPKAAVVFEGGNDHTSRYRRAHRNALENIPLFLITGYLLALTPIPFAALATLFGIFTVARITHSICYLRGIQPFRTASFAIGALVQIGILGYLGYTVATSL